MEKPAPVAIGIVRGVPLGVAVGLVAACATMGDGGYRASSLQLLVPSRLTRLEAGGVTLVAGRLRARDEVLRVLGPRSGKLFADGIVIQASLTAGAGPIGLEPDAFALVLDSGHEVSPATSEQVLAAVSLPESSWATPIEEKPFADAAAPHLPGERGSPPPTDLSAWMAVGIAGIDAAVVRAGAAAYRTQARPDVVAKTSVPSEVGAGESRDLLLVFVPPGRPAPPEAPVRLRVTVAVAGSRLERTLALE